MERTPTFLITRSVILVLYIAGVVLVTQNGRQCIAHQDILPFCEVRTWPPYIQIWSLEERKYCAIPSAAPVRSAIQGREHNLSVGDRIQEKGSFSGRPRPDLDEAWHDLLNGEPDLQTHSLPLGISTMQTHCSNSTLSREYRH